MASPNPQRGFTLIEVMVALALMAVLSAMAYKGVSAMVTAQERIKSSTEKTQSMQAAFAQWSQDWNGAASLIMRPGVHFTGNAIRMVRASSNGASQVVAWKNTPSGLERLAWPAATNANDLKTQWDTTWQWIQQSSTSATFGYEGSIALVDRWPMLHDMAIHYYMENAWTSPFNTDTSDGWPDAVRLHVKTPNGSMTLDWKNVNLRSDGKP